MRELLSHLGARLGNWNDRVHPYDTRSEQSRRHRAIDRLSSWLHVLPDRPIPGRKWYR